jgi:type VI protein secretion system component Hcp
MSMYLDVVGVAGESMSAVPNWNQKIDDHSMGYDVSQKTSLDVGSGLAASGAIFGPMQISKVMDKSTPLLWSKLCAGEPITMVTIRVSRPGANPLGPAGGLFEAEKYILENVFVTSYHTSGSPGPGGLPVESWSLAFTAITELYRTVDVKGNLQAAQISGWDVSANSKHTAPGSTMGNPS